MDTTTARAEVLAFAAQFPTPNVQRMVALCQTGAITWAQAHELARQVLADALAEVAR